MGFSPHLIAERIGNTVQMVNSTYGHLYPSKHKEVAEKLNEILVSIKNLEKTYKDLKNELNDDLSPEQLSKLSKSIYDANEKLKLVESKISDKQANLVKSIIPSNIDKEVLEIRSIFQPTALDEIIASISSTFSNTPENTVLI